jgi:osmotically-inducible protein OsmY
MNKVLLTMALAGVVGLSSCTTDRTAETGMTDSEMQTAIENQLQQDMTLRNANLDVDVDAEDREATISGTVYSQNDRQRAIELARTASPGYNINDKIEVEAKDVPLTDYTEDMATDARNRAQNTGDKIGSSLEDAWIHTKLSTKFAADTDTPAHEINIDVVDNVVTLRGRVETEAAKAEAARIAKETDGVKQVKNMLTVGPDV